MIRARTIVTLGRTVPERNLCLSFGVNGVSVMEVTDFWGFVFKNFQLKLQRTEFSYYTSADVRSLSTLFPNYTD